MDTKQKFKVKQGEVVLVSEIPDCNFCPPDQHTPGPIDFATRYGPWANGCEECWEKHAARPGVLGVGVAQRWITADQVA